MNIIFVSNKMARARTVAQWEILLIAFGLVCLSVLMTLLLILPQTSDNHQVKLAFVDKLRSSLNQPQKHLDAYADLMGEMQARIVRLDLQTERLAKIAGESKDVRQNVAIAQFKTQRLNAGGPLVLKQPKTEADLKKNIELLLASIEYQTEYLDTLEAGLLQQSVYKDMLPNSSPVDAAYNSSSYGWRSDPFTGRRAFHEGLDFTAAVGAPIFAAGDGVVNFAEHTAGYGNLVKVDHGSGLETRYAHTSKLLVKVGDRVSKGQIIAEVGNTGRSTGPHLHYEVRLNSVALDPRKYLKN